jgi:hypothetical protein
LYLTFQDSWCYLCSTSVGSWCPVHLFFLDVWDNLYLASLVLSYYFRLTSSASWCILNVFGFVLLRTCNISCFLVALTFNLFQFVVLTFQICRLMVLFLAGGGTSQVHLMFPCVLAKYCLHLRSPCL